MDPEQVHLGETRKRIEAAMKDAEWSVHRRRAMAEKHGVRRANSQQSKYWPASLLLIAAERLNVEPVMLTDSSTTPKESTVVIATANGKAKKAPRSPAKAPEPVAPPATLPEVSSAAGGSVDSLFTQRVREIVREEVERIVREMLGGGA